jgi:hypothetical protein
MVLEMSRTGVIAGKYRISRNERRRIFMTPPFLTTCQRQNSHQGATDGTVSITNEWIASRHSVKLQNIGTARCKEEINTYEAWISEKPKKDDLVIYKTPGQRCESIQVAKNSKGLIGRRYNLIRPDRAKNCWIVELLNISLWSLAFARSAFIRFDQRPMPFAFLLLRSQSESHLIKVDNQERWNVLEFISTLLPVLVSCVSPSSD